MTSLLLSVPVVAKESSRKDFPRSWNPDVFAEFSVTAEREVELNRAEARYFHKKILQAKEPNFDLNLGYDSFQSKDDLNGPDGEKLDVLCKWLICQAKQRGVPTREICYETDFVCYRGLLTRIASTPYDQREGWKLCAVRIGSTIFLCEFQTEKKKQEIAERTDRQKLMCYWGFKFEQFATTDRPNSEPNTSEAVSNLKEFDVVLRAKLGENEDGVRLMFAAETDCFDAEGNYLELKTVTSQNHQLAGNFWMMKAMKWWLQSYLAGIQRIIVGFRTWQGIVKRVAEIKVDSLRRNGTPWSPSGAINFLKTVLQLIREKMFSLEQKSKDPQYVLFEYDPSKSLITYRLVDVDVDETDQRYCFLMPDFIDQFVKR